MSDDMLVNRGRHRDAPDDPSSGQRRVPCRGGLRLGLTSLALLSSCAGLSVLYFHQSLSAPFNSDGAANVLQAQAIIHGNPLLRGWWTSDVSFYTTELPEYALVTAIRGLAPNVVHVCGAITYTLTVLLTALVARGRERGAVGYCQAGIATGIVLALSVTGSIGIYLENPNHAGTVVPVLAFLLLLDRVEDTTRDRSRGRWLVPLAVCALLAVAAVGDQLTLAVATGPLAAVCAVRLIAGRLVKGDERRRAERALLAAAVVSAGLAWLVDQVIRALGGFDLRPVAGVAVASPGGVPGNASLLWQAIVLLFGANQPGIPHQPQMISAHVLVQGMSAFHVIGLLVAAAGLAAGIASLRYRHADRGTQVIVVAILVLLAFGLFSTLLRSRSYIHEIAVLPPLSAALAGRVLVPLAGRRLPKRLPVAPPSRLAFLILGGWLALSVAEVCYTATWPALQPSQEAVAAWLVAHHEHTGLAGYWQAGSTTVTSGGQVIVAAIRLNPAANGGQAEAGEPAAYRWETSADWYSPARHDATFVIAVTDPAAGGGLSAAGVRARFGRPVAQYLVGRDVIMLYRYNLLTRLAATTFPGQ